MDGDGNPVDGVVIWADVKQNVGDVETLEGLDPDTTGFFLLSDGGTQNPDLADGTAVTFEQDGDGNWQVLADGVPLEANSSGGLLFSNQSLNQGDTDFMVDSISSN